MDTSVSWHAKTLEEIKTAFVTDFKQGLTHDQVRKILKKQGTNTLTQNRGQSRLSLLLQQFIQPLVYILLAAATITLLLGHYVDSGVIFAVVILNALIGYFQEHKALKAISALSLAGFTQSTLVREDQKHAVDAKEIVPGDIVILTAGDKVPADIRLITSKQLQVDESSLTGESVSVEKTPATLAQKTDLADRTNMLFRSGLITSGSGAGVVVATGDDTQIGQINTMIGQTHALQTPLTKKIARFSRVLLYVILATAALTFAIGMAKGGGGVEMFMAAVALSVAAIPEGLPAAMTIILAIGVSRMAKQNAIIRKLPAVETLGSTTVICSDKTGTLTQNEMTVDTLYAGKNRYSLTGVGYNPTNGAFTNDTYEENEALMQTLKAGMLCNEANLLEKKGIFTIVGDPTEAALLVSAQKGGLQKKLLQNDLYHIDTLDFDSNTQYMASYYGARDETHSLIYLKGSIEKILQRCGAMLDENGQETALDNETILQEAQKMAAQGKRVLAFASMHLDTTLKKITHDRVSGDLVFLGLQAMIDPPRKEVKAAVKSCQKAGIDVKMITGDHKITAMAIAEEIGLCTKDKLKALSGSELEAMDDAALAKELSGVCVFARVTPAQKLRLVQLLQAAGNVVAMTGDGVNDAPALKQADIGTAMGMAGTEVAKEASDMILTDDNFATIRNAVEEGRSVYANIIKFITWILPTNVGQGLVVICAVAFGFALPLSAVQILWVNMTTAVFLGLTLAFEPKEDGLMQQPPRKKDEAILSKNLLIRVIYVGGMLLVFSFFAFYFVKHVQNLSHETAQTTAVSIFIFGQMLYLLNCRSMRYSVLQLKILSNKPMIAGIVLMSLLQLLFIYAPFMHVLFGTAPMGAAQWGLVFGASILLYLVVEAEKKLRYLA
ncbi:MAG: cation-translocating P-type ATPase [Campylobacterota bacterium]